MDKNKQEELKRAVENLTNKNFGIYFFTIDTQGNAIASIANIYEHVKILNELGYRAYILHEKNAYTPVTWLGEEYMSLPHMSIESQQLKLTHEDFVIVPEGFATVAEQLSTLVGKRVMFCQAYDRVLETLAPGKTWRDYGVTDCITTTQKQLEYINNLFSNTLNVGIVPVSIPSYFKPTEKDKKPIVSIYTRDQRDLVTIFKSFYLKYPHLKWITFRDMRGLPREIFAKELAESCVAVWVDDVAGFGTFPIEAMKSGVPVIAKVPNIVPEYFTDKNGLWSHDLHTIPDLIANYVQAWLEDGEPSELYEEMSKLNDAYSVEDMKQKISEVYGTIFNRRKEEISRQLPKEELEGEVIEVGNDNTQQEVINS